MRYSGSALLSLRLAPHIILQCGPSPRNQHSLVTILISLDYYVNGRRIRNRPLFNSEGTFRVITSVLETAKCFWNIFLTVLGAIVFEITGKCPMFNR